MLEHSCLLVQAWAPTAPADGEAGWIRPIADTAGRSLGFVRQVGNRHGSWLTWLRKVRLDVYETDDASHLLSLTRAWGMLRIWEVDDAEDRHVGSVYTKSIVSSGGDRLGFLDRESAGHGRILDRTGRALLRYGRKNVSDIELVFALEATENPFLRMLMLGCILTLDQVPSG